MNALAAFWGWYGKNACNLGHRSVQTGFLVVVVGDYGVHLMPMEAQYNGFDCVHKIRDLQQTEWVCKFHVWMDIDLYV